MQPLTSFRSGARVRVEEYAASGCGARCRLCALGLTPGTLVEISGCTGGPCRLRVRGSDLVLGHGLAEKVLASPVD
ncbi:FeoA family protein [Desulfohalovibrio reitneri]|uniref:FeoA family protein n=1 Tax=Desulfohalovibrio reitneri TaxID=1307759 RepID=UPI0004A6B324|nr:FeoA family protein [Desulfohalovibrio reitneri]